MMLRQFCFEQRPSAPAQKLSGNDSLASFSPDAARAWSASDRAVSQLSIPAGEGPGLQMPMATTESVRCAEAAFLGFIAAVTRSDGFESNDDVTFK